jgi:hypothetical protein
MKFADSTKFNRKSGQPRALQFAQPGPDLAQCTRYSIAPLSTLRAQSEITTPATTTIANTTRKPSHPETDPAAGGPIRNPKYPMIEVAAIAAPPSWLPPWKRFGPRQDGKGQGVANLAFPGNAGAIEEMQRASDYPRGKNGAQCQGKQQQRQLCFAKPIDLLECGYVRRPNSAGESIPHHERGNSPARGCCRTMPHLASSLWPLSDCTADFAPGNRLCSDSLRGCTIRRIPHQPFP